MGRRQGRSTERSNRKYCLNRPRAWGTRSATAWYAGIGDWQSRATASDEKGVTTFDDGYALHALAGHRFDTFRVESKFSYFRNQNKTMDPTDPFIGKEPVSKAKIALSGLRPEKSGLRSSFRPPLGNPRGPGLGAPPSWLTGRRDAGAPRDVQAAPGRKDDQGQKSHGWDFSRSPSDSDTATPIWSMIVSCSILCR